MRQIHRYACTDMSSVVTEENHKTNEPVIFKLVLSK